MTSLYKIHGKLILLVVKGLSKFSTYMKLFQPVTVF